MEGQCGDPNSQWGKEFRIEKAVISSEFNVSAKKHQGIPEFYGDDIALLKLDQKVKMSTHARPICLPCTVGANLALRRHPGSTCRDHEKELEPTERSCSFCGLEWEQAECSSQDRVGLDKLYPGCLPRQSHVPQLDRCQRGGDRPVPLQRDQGG